MSAVVYRSGRMAASAWKGGCVALVAATLVTACAKKEPPPDPRDLSGVYWATEYHAKIPVVGGGELPFTAAGKKAYAANVAGLADGSVVDRARKYCTPDGVPRS